VEILSHGVLRNNQQFLALAWKLCISLASPPLLYADNINVLHMIINPVFHAHNKHIELNYHYVHERIAIGHLVTPYIPTNDQVVDLFTKPMSKAVYSHTSLDQILPSTSASFGGGY